ncbi:MAG: glycosyltransferase family 4 protein [Planctomycetes bacterium]|nr:glycosyltransferase family 4 protein [Planctomycetota bacterium]
MATETSERQSPVNGSTRPRGVNILAPFNYPSGLSESAHSVAHSLAVAGIQTLCCDVPVEQRTEELPRPLHPLRELHDVTLLHVQPNLNFEACYARAGMIPRTDVYRAGIWYWELESAPPEWAQYADLIHEVWAPTEFIARALERVVPTPIIPLLPGLKLRSIPSRPRSQLGLPEDRFLFLFVFAMSSIVERKNPLAVIEAFARAFRGSERVALAIKVLRGDAHPTAFRQLVRAAKKAGVIIIDQVMSREESYALMNACDCYVSLHRAEGLGLTMAEAMLMGKPVIATGYSGNLSFMTPSNSLLVDYRLVPIRTFTPPYSKGSLWAEPSVEHAARCMQWAYSHRHEARALGARAQSELRSLFSPEAAGQRMSDRLQHIHELIASDRVRRLRPFEADFSGTPGLHSTNLLTRIRIHAKFHGLAATARRILEEGRRKLTGQARCTRIDRLVNRPAMQHTAAQ